MSLIQGLLEWSEGLLPFGWIGLFTIAFMESSFFPVPPDIILIPLALAAPELALFYGAIATIGSVLGAVLGYYIGIKGGRPLLLKLAGERRTGKVENYFSKYGNLAIGIAGFSPIPYKIFTIASGALKHDIKKMLMISAFSRGSRFMLEAALIMIWGKEIISFLDVYFGPLTLGMVAIFLVFYFMRKKLKSAPGIKSDGKQYKYGLKSP